eukprot:TRINITY_DN8095_c0_g1_i1.p1 TRINITY_DN8095_c0_g1~~TRINITY_DN8095_c0_g1_i1.p1  ORF type:complete len:108 (+),score=14.68 TRINITY_DN8095_c0_g1_i1:230-553(+)
MLSSDFQGAPSAHLADGWIDLICLYKDVPRSSLVNLMVNTEKCVKEDFMEYHKVRRFMLAPEPRKPTEEGGILSLDGERIPSLTTWVECHRGLANMICRDTGHFSLR